MTVAKTDTFPSEDNSALRNMVRDRISFIEYVKGGGTSVRKLLETGCSASVNAGIGALQEFNSLPHAGSL